MGVDPLATRGADRIATEEVAAVGKALQVTLNDHIVVADPRRLLLDGRAGWVLNRGEALRVITGAFIRPAAPAGRRWYRCPRARRSSPRRVRHVGR